MVTAQTLLTALATIAATAALLLRRRRRQGKGPACPKSEAEEGLAVEIPEDVKKVFMFWGGALSGIISAAVTHGLEVLKIRRHVGRAPPETLAEFVFGMPMGSFAQGERFAATLVLDATLQKRLSSWKKGAQKKGGGAHRIVSFLLSMLAAGSAEFLSNPPVVVKNYQIANSVPFHTACVELWREGGLPRFFSGVSMGVLRKSLANAIVLQAIGPTKHLLGGSVAGLIGDPTQQQVALSFVAGSLTGGLAEVLTNPPDQIKTLTQTGKTFAEALAITARNPFRGAAWAGLRKGVIRGINWGGLALCMAFFERLYRARAALSRRKDLESGAAPSFQGA